MCFSSFEPQLESKTITINKRRMNYYGDALFGEWMIDSNNQSVFVQWDLTGVGLFVLYWHNNTISNQNKKNESSNNNHCFYLMCRVGKSTWCTWYILRRSTEQNKSHTHMIYLVLYSENPKDYSIQVSVPCYTKRFPAPVFDVARLSFSTKHE